MKKGIGLGALLLFAVFVFSGCASDKPASDSQDVKQTTTVSVEKGAEQSKLLSASEDGKVKLYEKTNGVIVDVNGSQKEFNWEILNGVTKPRVSSVDLTGDGKEEVVIILVTGHGTNLDTNEAHILDGENLSEIKIQNVEDIIADLETEVKQKGNELLIKAKAQGKEYNCCKNVSELTLAYKPDDQFENKLYFGDLILNNLKDQKLTVNIGGFVRPINAVLPDYVCTVHVTYKYDQAINEFVADQIDVIPDY